MSDSWEIYDALIGEIPADLIVEECIIGLHWTFIRAGRFTGIAMTYQGSSLSGLARGPLIGRSLRDLAAGLKSWEIGRAHV